MQIEVGLRQEILRHRLLRHSVRCFIPVLYLFHRKSFLLCQLALQERRQWLRSHKKWAQVFKMLETTLDCNHTTMSVSVMFNISSLTQPPSLQDLISRASVLTFICLLRLFFIFLTQLYVSNFRQNVYFQPLEICLVIFVLFSNLQLDRNVILNRFIYYFFFVYF